MSDVAAGVGSSRAPSPAPAPPAPAPPPAPTPPAPAPLASAPLASAPLASAPQPAPAVPEPPPASRADRVLIRAVAGTAALALALFVVVVFRPDAMLSAGAWAASAACALLTALSCARAVRQPAQPPAVAGIWRRVAAAMALVGVLMAARLVEWLIGGEELSVSLRVVNVLVHVAILVLLSAPVYRRSLGLRTLAEKLALVLDVVALALATVTYVWFFPVRSLLDSAPNTPAAVRIGVAALLSAVIGVVFGAKAVFISFGSVQRQPMLLLGAALSIGGIIPALLLACGRSDLGASMPLVPVVCVLFSLGARPGAAVVPLLPDDAERWRRRYSRLPYLAVAATDALLLGSLADPSLRDRLVVGFSAVLLTGMAVVRQVSASEELRRHEQRFRSLVQNSYDVVTINEPDGTITYMSGGSQRMFGRTPDQRTGGNITELIHPDDKEVTKAHFRDVAKTPGASVLWKSRLRHADGSWRWIEVLSTNMLHDPSVRGIVSNTRDITETHVLAERLSYEASHDVLTGLANRGLFQERVAQAVRRCGDGAGMNVILVDLDNFKIVNDTLGHAAGDLLLIAVADRLRATVRAEDTVARLGGDEFALLLEDIPPTAVERVVTKIIDALHEPLLVDGQELRTRASFGIVAGAPSAPAGDLLRSADIAMYEAKSRGDGSWQHYEAGMQARGVERDRWAAEMRRAVLADELRLHYQPVVTLPCGELTGVEALVRWQHPERGLIGPGDFIPTAEETGLIVQVGAWVLREACRQAVAWGREHRERAPATMSVNVSARQLQEASFADDVAAALRDAGLEARRLTIEITESTAVGGLATTDTLTRLRAMGVRLALDDFGTGQSTLSLLANCPVDQIKLDRSFVPEAGNDVIATAVLQLARGLGVEAVAEGVETAAQAERLSAMGYERAQGYHFARPMPADALGATLAATGPATSPRTSTSAV
jgi:diguanylate cyclase (GGDEF)-like protein/PAS domain S-box-containing protein